MAGGRRKNIEHTQSEHLNSRDPDRRLKIGYVSADFRTHSAAFCFKPVLLNHDKTRFEITCYSSSLQVDSYTEDFRRAADRWRNVTQLTGDEFSAQIRTDEIDILVDLSGHRPVTGSGYLRASWRRSRLRLGKRNRHRHADNGLSVLRPGHLPS